MTPESGSEIHHKTYKHGFQCGLFAKSNMYLYEFNIIIEEYHMDIGIGKTGWNTT